MKINIFNLVGKNAVTYQSGKLLSDKLIDISNEKDIVLDFKGVKVISSQFFNISIGTLLNEHSRTEVEEKIKVINAPDHTLLLLKEVLDNAEKFY